MHYNRYRYYHPRAGRFVSKAPINDENGGLKEQVQHLM
ncbi:hypothetical protein [Pseudomonas lundensis]|nr:hypothetical protein [Pseudomonas lundensis]